VADILLGNDANINAREGHYSTALQTARPRGYQEVINFLIAIQQHKSVLDNGKAASIMIEFSIPWKLAILPEA
jgi:ankyrin repeat protein